MHFKRLESKPIVRRDKDHRGQALALEPFEHAEPVELRHLDIEKDQVGSPRLNDFDRLQPVAALADDFDIRRARQQLSNPRGPRLVRNPTR